MFKIMALADIHLRGGQETEEARALMRAARIARDEAADLVLVAGDVFHAQSTPAQRLAFKRFLDEVRGGGARVLILRGNHDQPEDLMVFEDRENHPRVFVHEVPDNIGFSYGDGDGDGVRVLTIPHFNAGGLAAGAERLSDVDETGTGLFDALLDDYFQTVRDSGSPFIVAFHGVVSGAQLDNGMIPRQNGIHLNLARLMALGCPVIGGHYHSRQNVGGQVWYCGSITRQNYGETDDKGVSIWEWDGQRWDTRFISLDPAKRITINAVSRGGEWQIESGLIQTANGYDELPPVDLNGAYVRILYTVRQSEIPLVDLAAFPAALELAAEVKWERQVIPESASRSEAIMTASTVWEHHEQWLEQRRLGERVPAQRALWDELFGLVGDTLKIGELV